MGWGEIFPITSPSSSVLFPINPIIPHSPFSLVSGTQVRAPHHALSSLWKRKYRYNLVIWTTDALFYTSDMFQGKLAPVDSFSGQRP